MKTVLVTGARAPVALHWSRLLHAAGHRVILADSHRFPMSRPTRFKAAYLRLPPPRGNITAYARAVEETVGRYCCDLVVPTCEEVFFLAAARDLHGARIPLFAPSFDLLARVHDKYSFSRMARGFGADPPPNTVL
jgi:nucleoside-diphosphate-sugar epimerase